MTFLLGFEGSVTAPGPLILGKGETATVVPLPGPQTFQAWMLQGLIIPVQLSRADFLAIPSDPKRRYLSDGKLKRVRCLDVTRQFVLVESDGGFVVSSYDAYKDNTYRSFGRALLPANSMLLVTGGKWQSDMAFEVVRKLTKAESSRLLDIRARINPVRFAPIRAADLSWIFKRDYAEEAKTFADRIKGPSY